MNISDSHLSEECHRVDVTDCEDGSVRKMQV